MGAHVSGGRSEVKGNTTSTHAVRHSEVPLIRFMVLGQSLLMRLQEVLRKRKVDAAERGTPKTKVARAFGVSSVKRYVATAREGRSHAPKRQPDSIAVVIAVGPPLLYRGPRVTRRAPGLLAQL